MSRKELIIDLIGQSIIKRAEWLEENDPQLLDWIVSSKYWGRGFEEEPDQICCSCGVVFLGFWRWIYCHL